MRVNSRVFSERLDMMGIIQIPNCPTQFRSIAENIVNMATRPGYSVGDYNTMTELDKILMWDYWREFDGMKPVLNCDTIAGMKEWFIHKATAPELIRRARQWLVERNFLLVKPDVSERAYEASSKFGRAIKS